MPKRKTVSAAANSASEPVQEEELVPVVETRRTRSGRTIRTPATLITSQTPVKTPSRRTRKSVVQELPVVEEQNTEDPVRIPEPPVEEPEPAEPGGPLTEATDSDLQTSRPAPPETTPATPETIPKKKPHLAPGSRQVPMVPLGKPKSGRVWKDRNKQRFSALVRDKPLCSSWEKKMQARQEKQLVKLFTARLKQEDAQKKEEKRKRREENLKRREENERRAEIVQVIRNTTKIKRMKKKQLRKIEKRDTLRLLQKNQKTKTPKTVTQEFT